MKVVVGKEKIVDKADENRFEQNYSYESIVIKLLDAKKQTLIDTHFTYKIIIFFNDK